MQQVKSLAQAIADNRARHTFTRRMSALRSRLFLGYYAFEDRGRARQACRIIDRINKRLKGGA